MTPKLVCFLMEKELLNFSKTTPCFLSVEWNFQNSGFVRYFAASIIVIFYLFFFLSQLIIVIHGVYLLFTSFSPFDSSFLAISMLRFKADLDSQTLSSCSSELLFPNRNPETAHPNMDSVWNDHYLIHLTVCEQNWDVLISIVLHLDCLISVWAVI